MKFAILTYIKEFAGVLFSVGRSPDENKSRAAAWGALFTHVREQGWQTGFDESEKLRVKGFCEWKIKFLVSIYILLVLFVFSVSNFLFPLNLFQKKVKVEQKRRAESSDSSAVIFDRCDQILFELCGIDSETLADIPSGGLMNRKRLRQEGAVGGSVDSPGSLEAVYDESGAVVAVVGNPSIVSIREDSERVLLDLRRARLALVQKQSMLMDLKIQHYALSLGAKRRALGLDE